MFKRIYEKAVSAIVGVSLKHPYRILLITLLASLPTIFFLKDIVVDTDLLKLLPRDNPAYIATQDLQEKIGDGGHFIVVFEGADTATLKKAVNYSAEKIKLIDEVKDVQFKYPIDYISKYKYLLIPNDYLNELYDKLLKIEAKANPLSDVSAEEDTTNKTNGQVENAQDFQTMVRQYTSLPEYHQSSDGKYFGMLIPTKHGISSLGKVKELHTKIVEITRETEQKFGVKTSIGGNHMNKLMDYDTIMRDIDIASIIALVLIILLLAYSFRSIWAIALIIYPLILGLAWSFACVPFTFGSLNLITSFLTVILFGLGVDFPIHIVKRLQIELQTRPIKEAMEITFSDTGLSVIISALTTAAGFFIVIFSNFRGFYEFGMLSSLAIVMILIAMYLAFPAAVVIVWRLGGLKKMRPISKRTYIPGKVVTITFAILTMVGLYFTTTNLKFDYYLSNTDFKRADYKNYQAINDKIDNIYSASMSPAALYAAPDIATLDSTLKILKETQKKKGSQINRIRSIRDFAPDSSDYAERLDLIGEIKDILQGEWTDKITDSTLQSVIKDFRTWVPPSERPQMEEIPNIISDNLLGNKGSGYLLANVYPTNERKDGRNAIAFSAELDSLTKLKSVKGPVGETIIFADILKLVLSEAWWIVLFGQLLVYLVVIVFQRNIKESLIMSIPLLSGLLITFGIYGIFGVKITFFSVICIPVVMGMGIDGGIHYMNRWKFRNQNLRQTQIELFEPLSSAFLTVIFGYCGMILSSHSGLQSIGLLSSLGMLIIWIANLVFLPGIIKMYLDFKEKKSQNSLLNKMP